MWLIYDQLPQSRGHVFYERLQKLLHKKTLPGRKENKLGLRGSTTGELVLNNVEVSEDAIVGELGKGTAVAMKEIGEIGRASMATICLGLVRGCLEESVKFSQERIVYGKPISKLQAIQFHIAENRVDYEAFGSSCIRQARTA